MRERSDVTCSSGPLFGPEAFPLAGKIKPPTSSPCMKRIENIKDISVLIFSKKLLQRFPKRCTATPIDARSPSAHNARNNHTATNREIGRAQQSSPPEKNLVLPCSSAS
jgi:hypothetical protein